MKLKVALIGAAALSVIASSGCTTTVGLHDPPPVEIFDQRLTLEEIADGIKLGASEAGWEVTEEGNGYMLLSNLPDAASTYRAKKTSSSRVKHTTIRVEFDLDQVSFHYTSSENLRYEYITDDKQTVHFQYNRAINGLFQAIRAEIVARYDAPV